MDMMRIYGRLSSLNVQKVVWCLGELGLSEGVDYERIDAGLEYGVNDTPAYRALNPNGLVPTLVSGDFVLWESNTIVRYLASSHGMGTVMPHALEARADSERWMDWSLGTFWPALRLAFVGMTRTAADKRNMAEIRGAHAKATELLRVLDAGLAQAAFCAGSCLTVGDIALAVAVRRWIELEPQLAGEGHPPNGLGSVRDWYARIAGREAFRRVVGEPR